MSAIAAFMFLVWLIFIGIVLTLGVLAVITYVVIDIYSDVVQRRKEDALAEAVIVPDDESEVCDPPNACMTHGRCWTHSYWVDDETRIYYSELRIKPEAREAVKSAFDASSEELGKAAVDTANEKRCVCFQNDSDTVAWYGTQCPRHGEKKGRIE